MNFICKSEHLLNGIERVCNGIADCYDGSDEFIAFLCAFVHQNIFDVIIVCLGQKNAMEFVIVSMIRMKRIPAENRTVAIQPNFLAMIMPMTPIRMKIALSRPNYAMVHGFGMVPMKIKYFMKMHCVQKRCFVSETALCDEFFDCLDDSD